MDSEEERPLTSTGLEDTVLVVEKPLGLVICGQISPCQDERPDAEEPDRVHFSRSIAKTPILRQYDESPVATVLEPTRVRNALVF